MVSLQAKPRRGARTPALAAGLIAAALAASPASAGPPPLSSFNSPEFQSLTDEQAIAGCDHYASHPLDPMRPDGVEGVAADADVNTISAYLYCFRAFQADQTNPRINFQWGRVNLARGGSVGQPRARFKAAYRDGSQIAGVYLAMLPPEKTFAELQESVRRSIQAMRGQQRQRPMTSQERDTMLIGSIVAISSIALLRILSGDGAPPSECSGGHMIDINTHELLCNGLVVGTY